MMRMGCPSSGGKTKLPYDSVEDFYANNTAISSWHEEGTAIIGDIIRNAHSGFLLVQNAQVDKPLHSYGEESVFCGRIFV